MPARVVATHANLLASQSTSRQRRASSSPWRSPLIAAVKIERPVGVPEQPLLKVNGAQQRAELGLAEEADVGVRFDNWRVDELARVLPAPALSLAEDEYLVEQLEGVGDRLWRLLFAAHTRQQLLDVVGPHLV